MGVSKLKVENSFINYFDESTEIYRGMKNIDEKLLFTFTVELPTVFNIYMYIIFRSIIKV